MAALLVLDPKSRAIVDYLAPRRHASLGELTEVAGLTSQMETLHRIQKVINPLGRRAAGKDLMVLRRLAIDPATGQSVNYHWWLEGDPPASVTATETEHAVTISVLLRQEASFSGDLAALVSGPSAVLRLPKEDGHHDRQD
ncbi:MAG: hypothetical protein Q8P50_17595 [Bacillota bacterium]|nr:hypothetical protein [Bacillota bacterium]